MISSHQPTLNKNKKRSTSSFLSDNPDCQLKFINSEKELRDLLNQTRKSEEQISSDRAKYHEKRLAELNLETKAMATLSNEALRAADGFQDLYTKQQRESQIAVEKASIAVEQQKEKIKQLEKEGATHSDIKKQLEELGKTSVEEKSS